jgi:hypothetical protein
MTRTPCFSTWRAAGLLVLLGAVALPSHALAAPAPAFRVGPIDAPARTALAELVPPVVTAGTATVLYDDTGPSSFFYGNQGGHEAIDDIHMTAGGTADTVTFAYYDPAAGPAFSATVTLYGNPSALDLAATPLIGTYVVTGLGSGLHAVSVPLPDAPVLAKDLWIGVRFSSTTAGLVLHDVPAVGTSHDLYLENGNFYSFGGAPQANFALRVVDAPVFPLDVTTDGSGVVTKSPDRASYVDGTVVLLTAIPDPHWHLDHWSADASGSANPVSVVMSDARSVHASFAIDQHTLSVATSGNGAVGKTPDQPTYAYGTPVTLTATPGPGWHFAGWSGDASGAANPLTVAVDANKTITAAFAINTYALDVTVVGSGTVTRSPDQALYDHGTLVALTANPALGWHFVAWSGAVSGGTNPVTVTMDAAKSVTARFAINTYALAVGVSGNGSVAKSPDQGLYDHGTVVTLTAAPATGWHLASWSGDASGSANPLMVTMNGPKSITANFAINTYALAITTVGSGTVARSPDQALYDHGTVVTLTANPGAGSHFVAWGGDASGTASPTAVTMTAARSVTATFAPDALLLDLEDFEGGLGGWVGDGGATVTRVSPGHGSVYAAGVVNTKNVSAFGLAGTLTDDAATATAAFLTSIRYRVSAWVRSDAGHGTVRLRVDPGANGKLPTVSSEGTTLDTGWQPIVAEFVSSQVLAAFGVRILDQSSVAHEAFQVDDVKLELVTPAGDINLCSNGAFEADTHGWNPSGTATLSIVAGGHSGGSAMQLQGTPSATLFGCDDAPNWVSTVAGAGAAYRFTAWARSASSKGDVQLRVFEYLNGAKQWSALSDVVPLATGWQRVKLDYIARSAGSTLDLVIGDWPISNRTAETFLLDDVKVVQIGAPPANLLSAGDGDASVTHDVAPVVRPNPAGPGATLALAMAKPGPLHVALYDVAGRAVRRLADDPRAAAGPHRFVLDEPRLGAGVYFYRAEFGGVAHDGRFVVVR